MRIETTHNNGFYDSVTGERIQSGKKILITDLSNRVGLRSGTRTKVIGEDTIVWLAEAIGLRVVAGDARDSGDSEVVDGADVVVGGGEASAGEDPVGGKPVSKRRSNGTVKGK